MYFTVDMVQANCFEPMEQDVATERFDNESAAMDRARHLLAETPQIVKTLTGYRMPDAVMVRSHGEGVPNGTQTLAYGYTEGNLHGDFLHRIRGLCPNVITLS